MKVKLIIISIILLLIMVFACGCIPFMEKIGLINPTDEEQLSPEKASSDGLVKVLIGFTKKPGAAQQAMVQGVGGKIKYTYHIVDAIAASIPEKAIVALRNNPNVTHVELDGQVFALEQILPWGVDRIDAEVVHTSELPYNKGAGVKVAILDTGIDMYHPDLNVVGGEDFVYGKSYDDKNGHGTHVAGIVAALDNESGVIGVAPEAWLYAVKVLGNGGMGWVSDIIAGLEWSEKEGMQVVNMSFGGAAYSKTLEDACSSAEGKGLLLVASAGNSGDLLGTDDNVGYPAAYDSVIAVAATDKSDERASWSSTGPAVELAAPGVGIYSTYKNGGYATYSGTSMASPHVAGVAALVIASGVIEVDSIRSQLNDTAENIYLSPDQQGSGLVDAENAVLGTTIGDDLPSTATGTISGTVTDSSSEGTPIEGAQVTANGYSTTTSTDGSYIISDLSVGSYAVTTSATGYTEESKTAEVLKDQTTVVNFALTPAPMPSNTMHVSDITFSAKKAGINLFLYTTVEVLLGDKSAVNGAKVYMTLTHNDSGPPWDFAGDTGADGTVKFTLAKAPNGDYTATVTNLILTDYTWDTAEGIESASCELQDDGKVIQ